MELLKSIYFVDFEHCRFKSKLSYLFNVTISTDC